MLDIMLLCLFIIYQVHAKSNACAHAVFIDPVLFTNFNELNNTFVDKDEDTIVGDGYEVSSTIKSTRPHLRHKINSMPDWDNIP